MIEVYLFINPLGKVCLEVERKVLKMIAQKGKRKARKIKVRMIPLVNLKTTQDFLQRNNLPLDDIHIRNDMFEQLYAASLDYKALQLQGNQVGREFLLHLQYEAGVKGKTYNDALTSRIIQRIGADEEMFAADRASQLVKDSFWEDQQIAHEMQITCHPSAVVFNYASDRDYGVLIEDCECLDYLKELFETQESKSKLCPHHTFNQVRLLH